MNQFDLKNGSDIWLKLSKTAKLDTETCTYQLAKGEMGVAVNCLAEIDSKKSQEFVFVLSWDQPQIRFKGKQHTHTR